MYFLIFSFSKLSNRDTWYFENWCPKFKRLHSTLDNFKTSENCFIFIFEQL